MLGKKLKQLRGDRRQQDIADALGISRARYSHYENEIREPDHETLIALAALHNVSIDYLIGNGSETKLTDKEERDIVNDLQNILDGLDGGFAAYDGKTPEEIEDQELLKASLEQAMRLAKRVAKDKFTPKKYK